MGAWAPARPRGSAPKGRGSKVTGSPCVKVSMRSGARSVVGAAAAGDVAGAAHDLVDEAVLESFISREPLVAVRVGGDLLDALARLLRDQLRRSEEHTSELQSRE